MRADRGSSLVEVVVAVALMGIVVVPILSAVVVSIRMSSLSRDAARVETALVNAADRVGRAPVSCDYTLYAQAAVQSQGWAARQATVQQSYYVPGPSVTRPGTWTTGPAATPACSGGAPADGVLQRIRIVITSPGGKVTRQIEVVKREA